MQSNTPLITVFGTGAVGSFCAAVLAANRVPVRMVSLSTVGPQTPKLTTLRLERQGRVFPSEVLQTSLAEAMEGTSLAIFCGKANHLRPLLKKVEPQSAPIPLLLTCNGQYGLLHREFGFTEDDMNGTAMPRSGSSAFRLVPGSFTFGTTKYQSAVTLHGIGCIYLPSWVNTHPLIYEQFVRRFRASDAWLAMGWNHGEETVLMEDEITTALWNKTVINCVVNSLCGITGGRNGSLLDSTGKSLTDRTLGELRGQSEFPSFAQVAPPIPKVLENRSVDELARLMVMECLAARPRDQSTVDNHLDRIRLVCQRSGTNSCSTVVDVLHNKPTEMSFLCGFVADANPGSSPICQAFANAFCYVEIFDGWVGTVHRFSSGCLGNKCRNIRTLSSLRLLL